MPDKTSVNAAPIIIATPSANIQAIGATVHVNTNTSSTDAGGYYSKSHTATLFANHTHNTSSATSFNVGGSLNTNGISNVSFGVTLKY